MIAVDTNALVRFFVHDDATQAAAATALIRSDEIWITKTVLLEAEWVLRSLYGFTPQGVAGALRGVAGIPTVFLEDEVAVTRALDWFAQGLDFADALQLASTGRARQFATFDQKLIKQAARFTGIETISL